MDNAAIKLAPIEHRVSFLGKDPVMRNDLRIRCQCGWTEKVAMYFSIDQGRNTLMFHWERHVYTPEERLLLQELGG